MDKNNFLAPAVILALTCIFLIVTVLLFLYPNSAKLTKRKIRTGAAILALTSTIVSHQGCVATCYDMPEPEQNNEIQINDVYGDTVNICISEDTVVKGFIRNSTLSQYDYKILELDTIKFEGNLIPSDGDFNSNYEDFLIPIPSDIPEGQYDLRIYSGRYENLENYNRRFVLNISDSTKY
ncbi:MAG: hypothetical protein JXR58_04485 [Bacteroidales bacterium]|nr:hypothetical protein [Bacteroidales bacterium]